MTCTEIAERNLAVDYLYGELKPADRKQLEAHVAGCASCREELAALERTLGHARGALAGPLAEQPPSRVRAEVLRQAALAVSGQAQAAARAPARAAATTSTVEGFWAWLRRPWVYPAVGAMAAIVVFVIGKQVIVDESIRKVEEQMAAEGAPGIVASPHATGAERLQDERQAASREADKEAPKREFVSGEPEEAPVPPAAPADIQRPAAVTPPPSQRPARRPAAMRAVRPTAPQGAPAADDGLLEGNTERAGGRAWAEPPPRPAATAARAPAPPRIKSKKNSVDSDQLDALLGRSSGATPPPRSYEPEAREAPSSPPAGGAGIGTLSGKQMPSAQPPSAAAPPSPAPPPPATASAGPPPSAPSPPSAAPAPSEAPAEAAANEVEVSASAESAPRPSANKMVAPSKAAAPARRLSAAAPPPASPPPAPAAKPVRVAEATSSRGAEEEAGLERSRRAESKTKDEAADPMTTLMARADRLYTEGRWDEAIALYRELVRRYPQRAEAAFWKRRLDAANAAVASRSKAARDAKARTDKAGKADKAKAAPAEDDALGGIKR